MSSTFIAIVIYVWHTCYCFGQTQLGSFVKIHRNVLFKPESWIQRARIFFEIHCSEKQEEEHASCKRVIRKNVFRLIIATIWKLASLVKYNRNVIVCKTKIRFSTSAQPLCQRCKVWKMPSTKRRRWFSEWCAKVGQITMAQPFCFQPNWNPWVKTKALSKITYPMQF